ncbi:hypothetical protein [Paenibacillus lutrae]|uniref:HTH hxlR-type domain-containing protein n=1 Tax=Paenibacillus lutrae TaxID=2078573 RepID=A0A7X3K1I1_9BACL|nr:hypothetical protein [Paenibacillus lutrae]MVP02140.1 hypothetical protein [Paenibacillus lutrae]
MGFTYDEPTLNYLIEGLEKVHFDTLKDILNNENQRISYKDLRLKVSQLVLDKTLHRLLGARFVDIEKDAVDSRVNYYFVTENGKNALQIHERG